MPKLPPPPRRPQSRSAFSVSLAWTSRPSAVTTSAATRLSHARPCLRISQPMPPPSVKPATPVEETSPPVVASPWAWVSWSTSAQTAPPPTVARRASGIDADAVHRREVDHDAVVAGREAGDAVAPSAHGDREVVAAREADRGDHVGRAGAPDDERGPPAVVGAVPDPARLVVALGARGEDLSADGLPQLLDRRFPENGGDGVGSWRSSFPRLDCFGGVCPRRP